MLLHSTFIAVVFVVYIGIVDSLRTSWSPYSRINPLLQNSRSIIKFNRSYRLFNSNNLSFLVNKDENTYISSILKISSDSMKKAIDDGKKLIEIEFPASRKNDLGAGETLDITTKFTTKLIESFKSLGQQLWILLPDPFEAKSLRKRIGSDAFVIGSIDTYPKDSIPKLIVVINPGFNVDEYIKIPKIIESLGSAGANVPMVIINGNLGRLTNGYYPAIFYPGLYRVSQSYYKDVTAALNLSPISIDGNRFGAWIVKTYSEPWKLVIRSPTGGLDVVKTSNQPFDPQNTWKVAKEAYVSKWPGRNFF